MLDAFDEEAGQPLNRDYYLSTAPEFFPVIIEQLKEAGLHRHPRVDVRCIIEKPFGTDLESARALQHIVDDAFRERQVFRIDHYLGKETVQNVMAFRFANMMFEPIWNRNFIDHIQITGAEDLGIGTRAGYYDQAGALRDLVQNHMLQLVALTCMEPPASFEADKVRDEKVKVLSAITPPDPADTVRAQYTAGTGGGEEVPGYLRGGGRPGRLAHRDLRRAQARGPQLALGRRADLPAHRQAARPQGHGDRGAAQAGAAPGLPLGGIGRRAAQPARSSRSSPTRAWRSRSARRSPARACGSGR